LLIPLAWVNGLPPHLENGTDHHLLAPKEHKWMSGHQPLRWQYSRIEGSSELQAIARLGNPFHRVKRISVSS
jgi:hypothetical protein